MEPRGRNQSRNQLPCAAHGKEGVGGSSPPEGLKKALQTGIWRCLNSEHADTFRTHLRYERRIVTPRDACRTLVRQGIVEQAVRQKSC